MSWLLMLNLLGDGLELPAVHENDRWIYQVTEEKAPAAWTQSRMEFKVTRATASSLYYATQTVGSTQPPREFVAGRDWSRRRDVNGTETTVNQPLQFPLVTGAHWDLSYTEQHPNKAHRSEHWTHHYTVVGVEPVDVPSGHYEAIKIEAEGTWRAEPEPGQTVVQSAVVGGGHTSLATESQQTRTEPATGRTYKAFWYVPEVHRWVRSVEEYYSAGGVRTERYTQELESFDVQP
jgi:hypothetical protein